MGNTPNTITIQIGNSKRDVVAPESWNSLEPRTAMLFYQTLFTNPGNEYNRSGFTNVKLITMAQQVLRVDSGFLARWEADCLAEDPENGDVIFLEELQEILRATLAGLFEIETDEATGAVTYAPKLNLTNNLYPSLTHTTTAEKGRKAKTTWYYAPDNRLENITLYELAYTFTLFENYLNTNDDNVANQLIATLYRPSRPETKAERDSGWFGDRRMPLRKYEKKIAERAELARTLPALTRRLIVFWFASCRQGIIAQYGKVFRRDDAATRGVGYGWGGGAPGYGRRAGGLGCYRRPALQQRADVAEYEGG